MPKTKLDKVRDPHEKYRGAVLGRMATLGWSNDELARRMQVSPPTMRKYIVEPGRMKLDTIRKLNRILDLEADTVRGSLAVR